MAVPYQLFCLFRNFRNTIYKQQIKIVNAQTLYQHAFKYCTKFVTQQLKKKDSTNVMYYAYCLQYLAYSNVMRLREQYTQNGKGKMMKTLLEHCLEYDNTELASCSMFGENLLFNDSLIGWAMLTNAQYSDCDFPHVSIIVQAIKMQKNN